MSFNGDYVNFGCHKKMSIKRYIHHIMTDDIIFKIEHVLFLPKLQLFNLKTILFYHRHIQGEIDRMIDKDIDAYISKDM